MGCLLQQASIATYTAPATRSVRCVQPVHCPPCPALCSLGYTRVDFWAAAFFPPHPPDLVTSHCTEKAVFGLQAKFLLILAFLISSGKSEFSFSRSSIHIINELKQHLLSGISHQKKQFSSSLKTNNKTWVFQGFCCLWNTKILAIAWCKLKADLAKGRWDQFVDFFEQISKCIWMIRQTEQAEQLFLHCD